MQVSEISSQGKQITLVNISKLANTMAKQMEEAIKKIQDINEETHILALNAAIEASSAGDAGKGFGVVAEHMGDLSNETARITKKMNEQSQNKLVELEEILTTQATIVRGNRLANLAYINIDLIDRNLYERTADVRWWATDSSVVNAVNNKSSKTSFHASNRLRIILKYYTIYHDLILCDIDGNVIAHGNSKYELTGRNLSSKVWFKKAMNTNSGDDFAYQTVHRSPAIDDQIIMTFSCKVHQDGNSKNPVVGVLGTVFNWTGLAQNIVNQTPINQDDKQFTRVCIVDKDGTIYADTSNKILEEKIKITNMDELFTKQKNFIIEEIDGKKHLIGHSASAGFEGFSSGLHSLLIQQMK